MDNFTESLVTDGFVENQVQIISCSVMIVRCQSVRIGKMRIGGSDSKSFLIHQLSKGVYITGNTFGNQNTHIIGRINEQNVQCLGKCHAVPRFNAA